MNGNYTHTITLYNHIRAADNGGTEAWSRTVLTGCFYKCEVTTGFTSDGKAARANTYTVRIPESGRYLPYAEYASSPSGHFTVSQGDIVVHGRCTDEITGENGATAAQVLLAHKPDAFKVTAFADNTGFFHAGARHYRLGG